MTGDSEETPIVEVVTEGQLAAPSEVAPGTFFFPYFGNVIALLTDEGILLVDTATYPSGRDVLHELRARTDLPVHTIVYTHAHIDHAPGAIHFVNDARERGHPRPRVIAQRRAVDRLHRYERMMRHLAFISSIQWAREGEPGFGVPALPRFVYPDVIYEDRLTIEIGGEPFEFRAGIGETDDATWVWAPQRNLVCSGDMFLWSCPNVGNPWKVQRYTEGWAEALGAIAALHPAILLPGHGPPVIGEENVQAATLDTARFLRSIAEQVIERMNQGQWLEQILREVKPPADLVDKGYLRPIYGHPQFIIHGVWRQYGGWYDGNPANFFPASTAGQATEIVRLSGADALLGRARELQAQGDLPLACHLVDWVLKAQPENRDALALWRDLFAARAEKEVNMMARHTFRGAGRKAERQLGHETPNPRST